MSAEQRRTRRLALLALFQLDARGEEDESAVREGVAGSGEPGADDASVLDEAMTLALGAHRARRAADDAVRELAPQWPPMRQPAIDRAIIRLAHFEMTSGQTSPKVAVNEAIELAKAFSTDRSPAFVNGVLDKVLKRVLAAATSPAPAPTEAAIETPAEGRGGE